MIGAIKGNTGNLGCASFGLDGPRVLDCWLRVYTNCVEFRYRVLTRFCASFCLNFCLTEFVFV